MCGIAGVHHSSSTLNDAENTIRRMTSAIAHRGPDGEGFLIEPNVALGHRRLSIIDLAGGDQPIFNEDQTVSIIFNGEIYNYVELREDLIKRGHQFRTASDTETIVHLYEEYGVNCLEHLNGMFAFAIWDAPRQRLFLARDRLGEKPLYYSFNNGLFVFGSELKAVTESRLVSKEIDVQAVDDYLAYGYVPAPRTIYQNVSKLPQAHYCIVENGHLNIQPYWKIKFGEQRPVSADTVEELRDLVNDSIRIRLRSDVPVGAFLSGGIDSSLIVSHAAELSSQRLSTFSIGFSESDFDELKYARQIAERYNTDHHEFVVSEVDENLFPRIVDHFDEPFADPSAFPTWYVSKNAADNVKCVLSGDGGDELFCGYGRYHGESLEGFMDAIPLGLRRATLGAGASVLPNHFPGAGWLKRMSVGGAERWQRTVGILEAEQRLRLWRPEILQSLDTSASLLAPFFNGSDFNGSDFNGSKLDGRSQRMLADQNTYLTDDVLVKVDRNAMWHSLEVRVPLLDHRLVEYANSLPISYKYNNGSLKYPLKKLLEGYVPEDIIARKKTGFSMPIKHWLNTQLYEFSRELLLSPDSRCHAWFNVDELSNLVEANRRGMRDMSRRVWSLLWLEQWLRGEDIQ